MLWSIAQHMGGDQGKAREGYEKLVKANPRFAPAANNLAWMLAEEGKDLPRAFLLAQSARRGGAGRPAGRRHARLGALQAGRLPAGGGALQRGGGEAADERRGDVPPGPGAGEARQERGGAGGARRRAWSSRPRTPAPPRRRRCWRRCRRGSKQARHPESGTGCCRRPMAMTLSPRGAPSGSSDEGSAVPPARPVRRAYRLRIAWAHVQDDPAAERARRTAP